MSIHITSIKLDEQNIKKISQMGVKESQQIPVTKTQVAVFFLEFQKNISEDQHLKFPTGLS